MTSDIIPEKMPKSAFAKFLVQVAKQEDSIQDVLRELASEAAPAVRAAVAKNPNTSIDTLVRLSKDESVMVRVKVAGHSSTPLHTLLYLALDTDVQVRETVLNNPSLPSASKLTLEEVSGVHTFLAVMEEHGLGRQGVDEVTKRRNTVII